MSWLRRELTRFFGALRFFTRLPVPAWVGHDSDALARSAKYFPLIGLLVGTLAALAYVAASQFWPPAVAIVLSMACSIYVTGAFHEDGLSDTADGLGGGWDKERILAIMKDSRVGSYGVIALVLALLGKFVLLQAMLPDLLPLALIGAHAFSRLCATALLARMDYVREDAQSKAKPLVARMSTAECLLAAAFGLLPLLGLPWLQVLPALLLGGALTLWLAGLFRRWLGGYTGDCLGAVQQLSEIGFYLGLLVVLPQ